MKIFSKLGQLGPIAALAALTCGFGPFSCDPKPPVCAQVDETLQSVADKAKGCSGVTVSTGMNTCDLQGCTEADTDMIRQSMECMAKIPACTPGNELPWLFGNVLSCARATSPACHFGKACPSDPLGEFHITNMRNINNTCRQADPNELAALVMQFTSDPATGVLTMKSNKGVLMKGALQCMGGQRGGTLRQGPESLGTGVCSHRVDYATEIQVVDRDHLKAKFTMNQDPTVSPCTVTPACTFSAEFDLVR